ncbi:hypothetical protein EMIT0P2_10811 [Pseudomonas sp. IT-P2]
MPPDGHRSEGTLSLSEVPYAGAKTFWLLLGRLPKVTRCKSETASGSTRSNGYAPTYPNPPIQLTKNPRPWSPTQLVTGALHRVKRETGESCALL